MPRRGRTDLPPHVHRVTSRGKTYWYHHPRRGQPDAGQRTRINGDGPHDPVWVAHVRDLQGNSAPATPAGTVRALIDAYRAPTNPRWTRLTADTARRYNGIFERLLAQIGDFPADDLRPRHILAIRDRLADTPRTADYTVRALSMVMSWGIPRELCSHNPCSDVEPIYRRGAGYAPWPMDLINHARDHAPERIWHVIALGLYTGARIADVLAMQRPRNGLLSFVPRKTQRSKPDPLHVPVHSELAALIEAMPYDTLTIVAQSQHKSWTMTGWQTAWQREMKQPWAEPIRERGLVYHGLRKSAVCFLLESGASEQMVQSVTGQSAEMVRHYARLMERAGLARDAITLWEQSNCKTSTGLL